MFYSLIYNLLYVHAVYILSVFYWKQCCGYTQVYILSVFYWKQCCGYTQVEIKYTDHVLQLSELHAAKGDTLRFMDTIQALDLVFRQTPSLKLE